MGEIVKFPGKKSQEPVSDDTGFQIPSIDLLFDEQSILVLGKGQSVSVAALKQDMIDRSKTNALQNLETALTQARGDYIVANSKTPEAQKEALVGLAKYEYAIGRQMEHQKLMDWARGELIRGLGTTRALAVIESIAIKGNIGI